MRGILPAVLAQACAPAAVDGGGVGDGAASDTAAPDTGGAGATWPPLDPDPAWTSADRGYATGLGWIDVDLDGDLDLVVAYGNDMEPGPLALYENEGGALGRTPAWTSATPRYHGHLAVGDVDGDGWPDVAATVFVGEDGLGPWESPGGVVVHRNLGGTLSSDPTWSAWGFYSFSCALGDVDLDGDLDLAVAVGEPYYHDPAPSLLFENDGSGDLGEAPAWSSAEMHALDAAWTDLDGDGDLDLVLAASDGPHAAWCADGGALGDEPCWEAPGDGFEGNTVDWGDVDGDGTVDLAISDNDQLGGAGRVRLYCGADHERCWESADAAAMQSAVSLADVDGDGDLDLAAGAWWGAVRIYAGDGATLEATPSWTSTPDRIVVEALAWADVDGSDTEEVEIEGERLVALPRPAWPVAVEGGVAGDGWASGPGTVRVRLAVPGAPDLAVTDWDPDGGNLVFGRE